MSQVRTVMIGCGGMARHHIRNMIKMQDTTKISVVCEPSSQAYEETAAMFEAANLPVPANQPDLDKLLSDHKGKIDAAFIITPHKYHHDQTAACLNAGIDVLLEKPMVMNGAEAESLITTRNRTGKLLVVAFPGSLSPNVRTAVSMLRSGAIGTIKTISGVVWQNWGVNTVNTWRQIPDIAGGGFLFDTGAHLLNTTVDLAGEDVAEVAAYLDNQGRPVETLGVVIARLKSGVLVSLHGCGEAMPSCHSDIRVFGDKGIVYTGVWGEKLQVQYNGDTPPETVPTAASLGVWEQFLSVRQGATNPCPPEVGLRMAKLWDAIQASARKGGSSIAVR
ncbi:MAG: Gfo/Idh/MocA family protein [Roseiflexaceae bacterium]|jgi:predicted dehydrogenase|nr:Gfo/Idh/MocA family oxidoreductase [Chloroflexaceae bacterium]